MSQSRISLKWSKPVSFKNLDTFRWASSQKPAKDDVARVGLYVWLRRVDETKDGGNKAQVIYVGQSGKDLFQRQIDHACNWMSGRYLTYYEECNVAKLYREFLNHSGKFKSVGRMSNFSKFLVANKAVYSASFFLPDRAQSFSEVIKRYEPTPKQSVDKLEYQKAWDALMSTEVLFGFLEKPEETAVAELDRAETELILRIRKAYGGPLVPNGPKAKDLLTGKWRGLIAHCSKNLSDSDSGGVIDPASLNALNLKDAGIALDDGAIW